MISIGITGDKGFVGSHLFNTISLLKEEFQIIPFKKEYFNSAGDLKTWAEECDVIVHLAAMNRHEDPQFIHATNIDLVRKIIVAVESAGKKPHILFSSSVQEEKDNLYSVSKRTGRELFKQWAEKNNTAFTGMIIPNVFGPFCKPFYNSVVATFCYQLINGQSPKIEIDNSMRLIYIGELVQSIIESIRTKENNPAKQIAFTSEQKVSELLEKLEYFKSLYNDKGIFPRLKDSFEKNLFNTFRSYISLKNNPVKLLQHADNRGVFVELAKINMNGQVSFSTTHPGIVRGNHFHTRKIERFIVIKGKAIIQLRKYNSSEVFEFELDGDEPSYVDMPVWYIHNIKNTGNEELYTVFWINEFFDPADPDTYFETV